MPAISLCDITKAVTGSTPTPPLPAKPTDGNTGDLTVRPNPVPPLGANPWAPGSKWSVYQVYGYAGLSVNTYDAGCGDPVSGNLAKLAAGTQNKIIGTSTWFSALTGHAQDQAYSPTWLGIFGNLATAVHDAITNRVFWRYVPVGLLVAAVALLVNFGGKADLSGSTRAIGLGLLFLLVALFVLPAPTMVAAAAQKALAQVTLELSAGTSNTGRSSDANAASVASARVYEAVHYDKWLARTFGSATSATATKYGPDLFRAGAMSWAEADVCNTAPDGGACKAIIKAKGDLYTKTAAAVKAADPVAYSWLQGSQDGTGYSVSELAASVSADLFRLLAALVVAVAVASLVILALAFPAAAPLIVAHPWHRVGVSMLNAGKSALLYGVGFGAVAVLWTMVVQAVLSPALGLHPVDQVVVLALLTVAVLIALHPLGAIVSMLSFGRRHKSGAVKWALDKGVTAFAAAKGVEWGNRHSRPDVDQQQEEPARSVRFVAEPTPPLPPPDDVKVGRVVGGEPAVTSGPVPSSTTVAPMPPSPPRHDFYQRHETTPREAPLVVDPEVGEVYNVTTARDSYQRPADRQDANA